MRKVVDIKYDIYAAGPFFNPEQRETMDSAIKMMKAQGLKVFDPREHGPVLVHMDVEERKKHTKEILQANMDGILRSYMTIACIDDRDTGTSWELGFGVGLNQVIADSYMIKLMIPQITFSGKGFGANVMISESVLGHCHNLTELNEFLILNHEEIKIRGFDFKYPSGVKAIAVD
jgi:hypothetical protein